MLYLLLAISANIMIIFVMKFSERHEGNRYAATTVNYAAGLILSFLLMEHKTLFYAGADGRFAMALALFNACCMTSCMLLIQVSISKNGAPMTTTFNRLGVLIPTVLSMVFFGEIPGFLQIVGILCAVFAIVYLNGGDSGHIRSVSALLCVFGIGGMIDFTSKLYGVFGNTGIQEYFVLYTFIFCTVISGSIMLMMNRHVKKIDLINGLLMGIPNQLMTLGVVNAVLYLPAYLVFPLYSGGVILGVNLINFAVFREKLSRREAAATGIVGIALILLNI